MKFYKKNKWLNFFVKMRVNILVLAALIIIGTVTYSLMRAELMKNAANIGNMLARSYALEANNTLASYEAFLVYCLDAANDRIEEGQPAERIDSWGQQYFRRLNSVLGGHVITPYIIYGGKVISSGSPNVPQGYDVSSAEWYRRIVEAAGEVVYTDIYNDAVTGQPVITLAQAYTDSNLVVAFDMLPESFNFQVGEAVHMSEQFSMFLCDSSGAVIYMDSAIDAPADGIRDYAYRIVDEIYRDGESAHEVYDMQGQLRSVYSSALPNGWISIITIPHSVILGDLNTFLTVFLAVFLLCLLAIALMMYRDWRLNSKQERSDETVRVLSNSYYALYSVNLVTERYDMIKGSEYVSSRAPKTGDYNQLIKVMSEIIEPDAYDDYIKSFSLDNMRKLVSKRVKDFGGDFLRLFGSEYRWVNIRMLYDESSEPGEVVLCFREVDREKQKQLMERALLQDSLEHARHSEKTKHAFFNNMSHDMRTPLNAIIGLSDLAVHSVSNAEKTEKYLKKIHSSSAQLLELVNDILDMSRLEQGKVILDSKQFNIRECMEECAGSFAYQAERDNKDFTVTFDIKEASVMGDPTRIRQIMNNLLSNAFKYTRPGDSVKVEVRQFEYNEHAKYQVIIEDTGIGMSEEFLPQLFEPYTRETRFSANNAPGTGLGMPIVKSLITQMSGQINVESELGKGTRFTLSLPLTPVYDAGQAEKTVSVKESGDALRGANILLAEDNAINMEIATEILSMNGMNIVQAHNGAEAVEIFSRSELYEFDAVLMDMKMPEMDGCEAAEKIRALERPDAGTVPIVAITANAFAEDVAATAAAGMNAHVSKPIDYNILYKTLIKLISGRG